MNAAKRALSGCGTTSAALCLKTNTEKWNGSIWVTTSSPVAARNVSATCGTISDALTAAGNDLSTAERWMAAGLQKGFAAKIN